MMASSHEQDCYTGSLRPTARGLTNTTPNEQLKDRLVEAIETVIEDHLGPAKPMAPTSVNEHWRHLSPLDSKYEDKYQFRWHFPPKYRFPKEKISMWSQDDLEECNELLDLGQLYVYKMTPAGNGQSFSKSADKLFDSMSFDDLKEKVHVVLTRIIIAMLSRFNQDQYVDQWPIQLMITGNGAAGFPGYKWGFSRKYKGFPEIGYISGWSRDELIAFLEALQRRHLMVTEVAGYECKIPLRPSKTVISQAKYGYANVSEPRHQDARLRESDTQSVAKYYVLNSLFGPMDKSLERKEKVKLETLTSQSPSITDRVQKEVSDGNKMSSTVQKHNSEADKLSPYFSKASSNTIYEESKSQSTQLHKLLNEIIELSKKKDETDKALRDDHTRSLSEKDKQIKSLQTTITEAEARQRDHEIRLVRDLEENKKKIVATEQAQAKKLTEAAELRYQASLQDQQHIVNEAVKEKQRYKEFLDMQDDKLQKKTMELNKCFADISSLEQQIKELKKEGSGQTGHWEDTEESKKRLEYELSDARLQNATLQNQLYHLKGENACLSEEVKEAVEKMKHYEHEFDNARIEKDALNLRIGHLNAEIARLERLGKTSGISSSKRPLEDASSASTNPPKRFAYVSDERDAPFPAPRPL